MTTEHEKRLEELGGRPKRPPGKDGAEATRRRWLQLVQNQKVESDDPSAVLRECQAIARAAMPAIFRRWSRGARGLIPSWGDSAQIKAGTLLAGAANVALEARAGGGSRNLAELSLADLEASLRSTADALQQVRAIEGDSTKLRDLEPDEDEGDVVPSQGSDDSGLPTDDVPEPDQDEGQDGAGRVG